MMMEGEDGIDSEGRRRGWVAHEGQAEGLVLKLVSKRRFEEGIFFVRSVPEGARERERRETRRCVRVHPRLLFYCIG